MGWVKIIGSSSANSRIRTHSTPRSSIGTKAQLKLKIQAGKMLNRISMGSQSRKLCVENSTPFF